MAARAAAIAAQAADAAQRQAATLRVPGSVDARLGANAGVHNQSHIAGQPASTNAYARLGIDVGIRLPPGITEADVKIYDQIFGRFNPLRPQPAPPTEPQTTETPPQPSQPQDATATQGETNPPPQASEPTLADWKGLELAARIKVAVRERRAEISQLRDRALATGDAQLLHHCEHMESAMNAFVAAHAHANSHGGVNVANRPRPTAGSGQPQGQPNGEPMGNAPSAAPPQNGNGADGPNPR
jgi:hypothetical protein